jgi:hypothetical protein
MELVASWNATVKPALYILVKQLGFSTMMRDHLLRNPMNNEQKQEEHMNI